MENFNRLGPTPFLPDGTTKETDIRFVGGSRLKVYGGSPYFNFRLRYSNGVNEGWWVGSNSMDQLIAELLYIRRDMQRLKDEIALDVEVGRAGALDPRVEGEEVEEEDEAPY